MAPVVSRPYRRPAPYGRTGGYPVQNRRRYGRNLNPRIANSNGPNKKPRRPFEGDIKFIITTWNVEGKGSPEEIDKILWKSKHRPDIVCLQNANLPESSETENFQWLCSGKLGSAVLVNKVSSLNPETLEHLCDQICVADVVGDNDTRIQVISCYIPPPPDYLSEDLWTKLREVLKTTPTNQMYIVAGDFSAQIGKTNATKIYNEVVGQSLHHEVSNENGEKLLKLVRAAHTRIPSTFSGNTSSDKVTCKDGATGSQQDYIILPLSRKSKNDHLGNEWHKDYKHAMVSCSVSLRSAYAPADSEEKKPEVKEESTESEEKKADEAATDSKETEEKKPDLLAGTWNIQGATPALVDRVLNEQNLSVVCVQELFLTTEDDIKTDNFTWYSSKKQWAKNVAILVKTSEDTTVSKFEVLSECLCYADIVLHGKPIKVICCQLPVPSDPRHTTVTTQLTELVKAIPMDTFFILAGDFCAKMIQDNEFGNSSKNSEENKTFLNNLSKEANLSFQQGGFTKFFKLTNKPKSFAVSQISETHRESPHQILFPTSAKLTTRLSAFFRWVPFFENAIVCVDVRKRSILDKSKFDTETAYQPGHGLKPASLLNEVTTTVVNGVIHKSVEFEFDGDECDEEFSYENFPLSEEDREKYKNTPVSTEDLKRILNDFVVLFVYYNKVIYILGESFRRAKFPKFTVEDTAIFDNSATNIVKKTTRIKWNGIVLEEVSGNERPIVMKKKVASNLLKRLSQVFYTIKGKRSYFNKGLPPILMDDPKFADVLSVVKKEKCPTMPEVFTSIDEFFKEDKDAELIFGPDFSFEELTEIKKYAKEHQLDYRFFKSTQTTPANDHIALFKKVSSQELRDKLLANPEHPKYYLIPPSGVGVDPFEFSIKLEGELLKEDHKIVQAYWQTKVKGTDADKTVQRKKAREEAEKAKSAGNQEDTKKTASQQAGTGAVRKRQKKVRGVHPRASYWRDFKEEANRIWQQEGSGTRAEWNDQDRGSGRTQYESRQRWGSQDKGYRQADTGRNQGQYSDTGRRQVNGTRPKRESLDTGAPLSKKARMEASQTGELPKVKEPMWRDLAPLVIVWPVTARSETEERPHMVIEANFPVEYVTAQNKVAVVVALPLRNGYEKKYCLAIDREKYWAAKNALRTLVKHSTVIKYNPTYLCEGGVPNFVRYRVPCQTNPRTYIIVSRTDTGPITQPVLEDMLESFKNSFNEDVFFDALSYTYDEKMMILDLSSKYGFLARHFGDGPGVREHYVCISKRRPKNAILEEVLKMRDFHPKYLLATNRLPPRLGMNIF